MRQSLAIACFIVGLVAFHSSVNIAVVFATNRLPFVYKPQELQPTQYVVTVTGCNNDCDTTCCYCVIKQPPVCVQCCNEDP
ncbi:hypothetical protein BVRB_9g226000 [Beta vulgaris subsp. vulgaris]|uniref:Uncharacterized protein n=1 Tax=Beta vulgaris subsp. vulgaris TaxID=3555 RepID=A0A0J8B8P5_BETVV|nr:hypothetical protein BVRB_9g226000 [Beta vulgaris subsp. vulgaris]